MIALTRSSVKLKKNEEQLIRIMQALGDTTRFKIYKIMRSGETMCVSEIAGALGISTPAVSQHFRIFEFVGLVEKQRYGQKICYALKSDNNKLNRLLETINK